MVDLGVLIRKNFRMNVPMRSFLLLGIALASLAIGPAVSAEGKDAHYSLSYGADGTDLYWGENKDKITYLVVRRGPPVKKKEFRIIEGVPTFVDEVSGVKRLMDGRLFIFGNQPTRWGEILISKPDFDRWVEESSPHEDPLVDLLSWVLRNPDVKCSLRFEAVRGGSKEESEDGESNLGEE